jgi:hypothetical protein
MQTSAHTVGHCNSWETLGMRDYVVRKELGNIFGSCDAQGIFEEII